MSIYEDIQDRMERVSVYSNYFACDCIFDTHEKPALFVYEDKDKPEGEGRYFCVSCNKGGTHKYLWKKLTGADVKVCVPGKQVQKFLPQWARWQRNYGTIEELVQHAHENVTRFPGFDWYLRKRDLMPMYEKCKLGYMDEWMFFPIFDPQGKVIDVIVRDTKGRSKYIVHKNDEETPLLYVPSWTRVMESKLVYIVYGLIDAIALEMCGLPVITGSTGKSLSNKRLIQLNKKWAIIPDLGEEDAARQLAKALANFTHIIRLPYGDEVKDPDGYRMKFGLDKLKEHIIGE